MNMYTPGLITAYLLARVASAAAILVIVVAIACPLIWSRDFERRARSREALRLLVDLFIGRRAR